MLKPDVSKQIITHTTPTIFPKNIKAGYIKSRLYSKDFGFLIQRNDTSKNLKIVTQELSFENKKLVLMHQIHSDKVILLDTKNQTLNRQDLQADAIISKDSNLILCVTSADCGNLLIFDPKTQFRAVVHAGYKGLIQGVIQNTIHKMLEIGCQAKDLLIYSGPCISQKYFYVWKSTADFWPTNYKIKITPEILKNQDTKIQEQIQAYPEKQKPAYFVDLQGLILDKLLSLNIPIKNIEISKECTFENLNYHSYRKNKIANQDYNTNLGFIALE